MFWLLLMTSLCFADETVVTINKGAPAPFSGTLLSPAAAAKLLATGESDLAKCQIEAEKDKSLLTAEFNLNLKNKEAELAACTLKFSEYEKIYLDQIKYLEDRATQPNWKDPVLFATGVLSGIGVVLGSAWALNQIGDTQ